MGSVKAINDEIFPKGYSFKLEILYAVRELRELGSDRKRRLKPVKDRE
jgi:hypothetical protein